MAGGRNRLEAHAQGAQAAPAREDTLTMSTQTPTNYNPGSHRAAVESLIQAGILAPAARTMPLGVIAHQHNQANAMTPADAGYIDHCLPLGQQVARVIEAMNRYRHTRRRQHRLW